MRQCLIVFGILLSCFCSAQSAYEQGKAYYEKQEYQSAIPLLKSSAQNGSSDAYILLGKIYSNWGSGVMDYKIAFEMYSKSAEMGNAEAMRILGDCYTWETGVKADHKAALKWYI